MSGTATDRLPREGWRTAAVMAVCALFLSPILAYRMGLDQGVFAYIGGQLLQGRWPYLDTWDHAFPGLMFLQAVEILIFGKSIFMFRVFDLLWQLGNAYLIYRITGRIAGRASGYFAAGIFALIYQSYGYWNTGQREGFGLLFVLAGYWLYLTAERRRPLLTAVGIGLGMGIAITIKPTLLALSLFYLPLLPRLNRRTWPVAAVAVTTCLLPAVGFVLLYLALGGLTQMYEACIAFQMIYTQRTRGDGPLLSFWISKLRRLGGTAAVLGLFYPPFLFFGPHRRERLMLYLGFLGSVYAVFAQGTFGGYHYLPGLGVGAILIGTIFAQGLRVAAGWRIPGFDRAWAGTALASLALVALVPLYVRPAPLRSLLTLHFLDPPRPGEVRNETVFDFTEDWELAAYLRENTTPEERIQVWGHESLVYYLAERYAASRFQTSNELVVRVPGQPITEMQQRWRDEFVEDMRRNVPAFIAVVRDDRWWWSPGQQSSEELLDDFSEWKAVIEEGYEPDRTIGRFQVYRRRDL